MTRTATLLWFTCAVAASAAAQAEGYRDPTRPPVASGRAVAARAPAGLQFGGVVIGGDRRVALLNGRAVQAGDEVGGVKVIEVLPDGVRVSRAGRIEVLRLARGAPPVKTAAKEKLR